MPSAGQSPADPGPGRRLDREARLQKPQEGWVSSLGGCCLHVSWESLQRSGFMHGLSGCPHRAPKDGSVLCGAWVLSQSCQPGKVGSHGQWSGGCHYGRWRLAGPSWGERETGKEKAAQGQEQGTGWSHFTEDPRASLAQGWARGLAPEGQGQGKHWGSSALIHISGSVPAPAHVRTSPLDSQSRVNRCLLC